MTPKVLHTSALPLFFLFVAWHFSSLSYRRSYPSPFGGLMRRHQNDVVMLTLVIALFIYKKQVIRKTLASHQSWYHQEQHHPETIAWNLLGSLLPCLRCKEPGGLETDPDILLQAFGWFYCGFKFQKEFQSEEFLPHPCHQSLCSGKFA